MTDAAVRGDQALAVIATDDLDVDAEQFGHHADGDAGSKEHHEVGPGSAFAFRARWLAIVSD